MEFDDRTDQALCRMSEFVLFAMILLSPWAFGSVMPMFQVYLVMGAVVVIGLWGARMAYLGRLLWPQGIGVNVIVGSLAALALLAALQAAPLPPSLLESLVPARSGWYEALQIVPREAIDGTPIEQPSRTAAQTLSFNPAGSLQFAMNITLMLGLFVSVGSLRSPRDSLRRLSIVGTVLGFALAFFAIVQYLSSPDNLIYWYFEFSGARFGPYVNRNHYPFIANVCCGLCLGLFIDRRQRYGWQWNAMLADVGSMWLVTALAFIAASVFISTSRGGVLAFLFALGLFAWVRYRGVQGERLHTGAIVIGVLTIISLLLAWVGFDLLNSRLQTLGGADAYNDDGRWQLWGAAIKGFFEFPLFGSGGETFRYFEAMFQPESPESTAGSIAYRADNELLDVACEFGVVGGLLLVLFVASVSASCLQAAMRDPLASGGLFGLAAVIVHSFFDFGLRLPANAVLAISVVALVCNLQARKKVAAPPAAEANTSKASSLAGSVLAMGVAVAAIFLLFFITRSKIQMAVADSRRVAGVQALRDGELELGIQELESALLAWPEDPVDYLDTARLYFNVARRTADAGKREQLTELAIRHAVHARDRCPLAWEPYLWLAEHVSKFTGASRLDYLSRARMLQPGDADVSFATGVEWVETGQVAEAWSHWRASLAVSPSHLRTILTIARQHLSPEEISEQVLPNDPRRIYEAARFFNKPDESEFRQALLSRAYDLTEQLEELPADEAKRGEQLEFRSSLLFELGRAEEGIERLQEAVRLRPDNVAWRVRLVEQLMRAEDYEGASRVVRIGKTLHPDEAAFKRLEAELAKPRN